MALPLKVTKTKTKTNKNAKTKIKTNTKWQEDPTCEIYLKKDFTQRYQILQFGSSILTFDKCPKNVLKARQKSVQKCTKSVQKVP